MQSKVLVTYASKYGATAEIANRISQALNQAGVPTDITAADRVGDLTPYTGVVLGSAVYIGQWRKQATTFLKSHEKALAERNVWIFSSGPTGSGEPEAFGQGRQVPPALQPVIDRIRPRGVAIFNGSVDPQRLNFVEKWMLKNVKAPIVDARDWVRIASWATTIANAVKQPIP